MIAPEELQMILGIHPDQMQANQALAQAAQGDSSGVDADQGEPPPPEPRPISAGREEEKTEDTPDSKPLISAPRENEPRAISTEPVTMPKVIGPAMAREKEEEAEPAPPSTEVPGKQDTDSISSLMSTPIRPISADRQRMGELQGREATDRAELNRLRDSGSGISQFQHRHHILGPIVRALEIAGSVVSPGTMAMVPGTELHHNMLLNRAGERVESDIGDQTKHEAISGKEELEESRRETANAREEANRIKRTGMEEKFIAGSEHEDPNSPTGWSAQNFKGEWNPFQPKAQKNSKADDFEQTQQQYEKEARRLNLKGEDLKYYLANHKLKEPGTNIHVPSAASEELHDWEAAFERDNKRKPNADELAAFKHGGHSAAAHTKDRETFESHWAKRLGPGSAVEKKYDSQRQAVLKSYGADKDPKEYQKNKADIDAKFAAIETAREAEKSALQGEKDTEAEDYGVYNRHGAGDNGAAQPQQHGQEVIAPDSKLKVKIGQPVLDPKGNRVYVTGVNPKTGKIQTSPQPPQQ